MPYNPRPFAAGDTLVSSRNQIRENFDILRTSIQTNHAPIDSAGKHLFLQMPEQASDPDTAVNEGGLYVKPGTNPTEANLFFRAEDSVGTGGKIYQMTHVDDARKAEFATSTTYLAGPPIMNGGWTFLPGNIILNYGFITIAGSSVVITYAKPFASKVFSFSLSGVGSSASAVFLTTAPGLTTMTANTSGIGGVIYWTAIGI